MCVHVHTRLNICLKIAAGSHQVLQHMCRGFLTHQREHLVQGSGSFWLYVCLLDKLLPFRSLVYVDLLRAQPGKRCWSCVLFLTLQSLLEPRVSSLHSSEEQVMPVGYSKLGKREEEGEGKGRGGEERTGEGGEIL